MIPKPEAAVVWGKVITCIDKKYFVELNARFYDEEGELMNTMNGYDVKLMGGRMIPAKAEMIPADKPNQKTEIIYNSILFDKPIDDTFFSLQQLKNLN
jgi:hypothetical protein